MSGGMESGGEGGGIANMLGGLLGSPASDGAGGEAMQRQLESMGKSIKMFDAGGQQREELLTMLAAKGDPPPLPGGMGEAPAEGTFDSAPPRFGLADALSQQQVVPENQISQPLAPINSQGGGVADAAAQKAQQLAGLTAEQARVLEERNKRRIQAPLRGVTPQRSGTTVAPNSFGAPGAVRPRLSLAQILSGGR